MAIFRTRQFRDTFSTVGRKVVTLDFASAAAGAVATTAAQAFEGAAVGDIVLVTPVAAVATGYFAGTVSSAGNIVFFYHNNAAGTVDLASQTFRVIVLRPNFG